jgi:hypothetical protein
MSLVRNESRCVARYGCTVLATRCDADCATRCECKYNDGIINRMVLSTSPGRHCNGDSSFRITLQRTYTGRGLGPLKDASYYIGAPNCQSV